MNSKIKKMHTLFEDYGIKRSCVKIYKKITHKEERKYEKWIRENELSKEEIEMQKNRKFIKEPKFSIVIPLYKTPEKYLREIVESILKQTYSNWELCLSDGSGNNSPLTDILEELKEKDTRIKYISSSEQLKISDNTNLALSIATGDYIAFADHDDLLEINALYECATLINEKNTVDMIYSDEDKVSMNSGRYFEPHFKPDFNIDLLRSVNYFCHLVVVGRKVIEKVGGLNGDFDGAQDYDFVLRCIENTKNIYHIPKVLYHWRAHIDSTAENPESKKYAFEAGKRAVQEHYKRIGMEHVEVSETKYPGIYRSRYKIENNPKVTIILYNIRKGDRLKKCLESLKKQSYKNYEIITVKTNRNSINLQKEKNRASESAKGEYLLFLDTNCELIGKNSLEEMLGMCARKSTGAVGCKIFYKKKLIEHAGVVTGVDDFYMNLFKNMRKAENSYYNRSDTQMDYSAISGLCFMVEKKAFEKVSRFDEKLKEKASVIDLCLKLRSLNKLIVYNPYAVVYDSVQNRGESIDEDLEILKNRWKEIVNKGDPYYNQNLSSKYNDCQIKI